MNFLDLFLGPFLDIFRSGTLFVVSMFTVQDMRRLRKMLEDRGVVCWSFLFSKSEEAYTFKVKKGQETRALKILEFNQVAVIQPGPGGY